MRFGLWGSDRSCCTALERRPRTKPCAQPPRAGGQCCPNRRGEWWVRLSIDTEHLGRPEEALEARRPARPIAQLSCSALPRLNSPPCKFSWKDARPGTPLACTQARRRRCVIRAGLAQGSQSRMWGGRAGGGGGTGGRACARRRAAGPAAPHPAPGQAAAALAPPGLGQRPAPRAARGALGPPAQPAPTYMHAWLPLQDARKARRRAAAVG
jgi:hypothetical protein